MKRFTKYTFLLFAFLLMFNASDDNNDEKEYWGRTDAGQWLVKTLSDDTEGFTFGWELPEAKASKEAFEKDSFNPTTLKSTSLPKNSFVHRIGTHSEDDYKLHIIAVNNFDTIFIFDFCKRACVNFIICSVLKKQNYCNKY